MSASPESRGEVAAKPSDIWPAWDAAVDGWRQLAQLPSAAGVFEWEQIRGADCFWWAGASGAMAHQVFVTTTGDQILQTLDVALASPKHDRRCDVVVRSIDTPEFARALAEVDPQNAASGVFMMCDLTKAQGSTSPGPFRTAIISTKAQEAEVLAMVGGVYRDVGGLTAFFQGLGAAQIVGVYDRDRLVASTTIVRSGATANIWSVATAASERGRGAGRAAELSP